MKQEPISFREWLNKTKPKRRPNYDKLAPFPDIAQPALLYNAVRFAHHSTSLEQAGTQRIAASAEMIEMIP